MISNAPLITVWEYIKRRKQQLIEKIVKTKAKITYRTFIEYMRKYSFPKKFNRYEDSYKFPYPITKVWTNGTVTISRGAVQYKIRI